MFFLRTTQSSSVSIMEKQKRYTEGKRSSWQYAHRSELDPPSPFFEVCSDGVGKVGEAGEGRYKEHDTD